MTNAAPVWLFDLDNTLHDAGFAIFPSISDNMNDYIAQLLGKDGEPADAVTVNQIRLLYWQRYGTTMLGLVKHHQVRMDEFLHTTHQFDDLAAMIRAERGLSRLFRHLPGRKILLTNAPRQYSHAVLRHLNLHRHFAEHIPIEAMRVHGRMLPKPSAPYLRALLARLGVDAGRCILVEDTVANLRAAKQVGMRTALVTGYIPAANAVEKSRKNAATWVDVKVKSVFDLARSQFLRDI